MLGIIHGNGWTEARRYSDVGCRSTGRRRSPRTFAAAGFDYVFIDMEHGAYDLETVQDMITAANSVGITPIVRVCELLYSLCARLLDAGAQGIILRGWKIPRFWNRRSVGCGFPPVGSVVLGSTAP